VAMGREAARLADRRIHGDASPAQTIIIPTTLVERGSGERPPH
jgi:LacI family transcriptional regulator